MLTYCYQAWPAVPYLFIGGPLGSGKSRVFDVLARLVFRPLGSSNMTAAALFRTLHAQGGTLLLDEAERLKQTQSPEVQELLSMLLAGYKTRRAGDPAGSRGRHVQDGGVSTCTAPRRWLASRDCPRPWQAGAIGMTMFRAAPGVEKPRRRIDARPGRLAAAAR